MLSGVKALVLAGGFNFFFPFFLYSGNVIYTLFRLSDSVVINIVTYSPDIEYSTWCVCTRCTCRLELLFLFHHVNSFS